MKKIAAFLLSAVCFASLMAGTAACNPGKGENELVIGITYYAPMNYFDENGKLVGFDTEFAEKACAELGYTPVFKEIDWEKKQIALTTKEIDLIWNGMTIKEELKEYMSITDPYMENKQVVVVRAEEKDRYTDIASLSQATSIAVESGSAGETVTKDLGVEINGLGKQADCLLEVKSDAVRRYHGRTDGYEISPRRLRADARRRGDRHHHGEGDDGRGHELCGSHLYRRGI